ncbi:MAG TPA: hypothetical protein VNU66_04190 [Mycobacteriales bacterium]|nr:hypothetical protein [Mycobacteriales bacterium]
MLDGVLDQLGDDLVELGQRALVDLPGPEPAAELRADAGDIAQADDPVELQRLEQRHALKRARGTLGPRSLWDR